MNEPKQNIVEDVEDDEILFINLLVKDSILVWPEVCWSCRPGFPDGVCLWPLPAPGEIAA